MGPFLVKSCAPPETVARRCSIKKRVLNNFTGKHLWWSLFFDKAAGWRPETLLKRDFSTGLFLCIFRNTFSCEVLDILLLLFDIIFLMLLLLVVLPYEIRDKVFINHNGKTKSCFHVVGCHFSMFVYVLFKFDWLIFFFLEKPPRKLKILNFFFSQLFLRGFSNVTIAHAQFWNQAEFSARAESLT